MIILAEIAEKAEEIDLIRAEEEKARAEEILAKGPEEVEFEKAKESLDKAMNRLRIAGRKGP